MGWGLELNSTIIISRSYPYSLTFNKMLKTAVFLLSALWTVVYSTDVKIVSTPKSNERGPEPCVTQCYGSTGENTAWFGGSALAYVNFSTSDCGFKSGTSPLISTTLVQDLSAYPVDMSVYKSSTSRYMVGVSFPYQYRSFNVLGAAKTKKSRVDWIATGYTC